MATYTATDAEQDAVTWSLVDSGDDDDFTLDRRLGVLRFRSPPDYEAPTDSGHVSDPDTNNVYHITVRATDGQQASADSSVTVTVTDVAEPAASFSASGYRVLEGGLPVDAAGGAGLRDTVTVRLRPAPSRRARIPVTVTPVTAESGDYEVGGLDSSALVFAAQSDSQSFTIAARADADVADETIGLGFGPLPPGVVAGVPSTATVTIHDTPNRPSGLTATRGLGQVRLAWEAAGDDSIRGWQYRTRVGPAAWGSWTSMDGSEVTYAENDTSSVATYTAAGSDCGALTWTVAGADSSAFRLQGADSSRSLRFRASPDYEARSSPYRVTVQARGEGSSVGYGPGRGDGAGEERERAGDGVPDRDVVAVAEDHAGGGGQRADGEPERPGRGRDGAAVAVAAAAGDGAGVAAAESRDRLDDVHAGSRRPGGPDSGAGLLRRHPRRGPVGPSTIRSTGWCTCRRRRAAWGRPRATPP